MINDLDIVQWEYLLSPEFELINSAGKPLTGGWIEVYLHGTRDKYYCALDFSGTLHPFKIPLDSIGANVVLADPNNAYDVYVYNKFGSLIMSRYNVKCHGGGSGSSTYVGDKLYYGQFKATDVSTQAGLTRVTGNIEVDNGKLELKQGMSYHITLRGEFVVNEVSNVDTVLSYIEYSAVKPINVNVDYTKDGSQYFEISYDIYRLAEDMDYPVSFMQSNGLVKNLTVEVHSLSNLATSGTGEGSEYEPGWGIVIQNNVISVDPSILDDYATHEEVIAAVSGITGVGPGEVYTAGDYISIEDNTISVTGIDPNEYATHEEVYNATVTAVQVATGAIPEMPEEEEVEFEAIDLNDYVTHEFLDSAIASAVSGLDDGTIVISVGVLEDASDNTEVWDEIARIVDTNKYGVFVRHPNYENAVGLLWRGFRPETHDTLYHTLFLDYYGEGTATIRGEWIRGVTYRETRSDVKYLSTVNHDGTLTGSGTMTDPLKVNNQFVPYFDDLNNAVTAVSSVLTAEIMEVSGSIPELPEEEEVEFEEINLSDYALASAIPDVSDFVTHGELVEAVSAVTGMGDYGQFYCAACTGTAELGKVKGTLSVTNDGKVSLKAGCSYHVTVRGGVDVDPAANTYGAFGLTEFITGNSINSNIDRTIEDTQYFEISYDLYNLSVDTDYEFAFTNVGGEVNGLYVEIHEIGHIGSGSGGAVTGTAEYDAGWGINIVNNVISVDPTVIPEQVQSDWAETASALPSFIKNKPVEYGLVAGQNISIAVTGTNVVISSTGGSGGATYTEGFGIDISNNEIAIDPNVVALASAVNPDNMLTYGVSTWNEFRTMLDSGTNGVFLKDNSEYAVDGIYDVGTLTHYDASGAYFIRIMDGMTGTGNGRARKYTLTNGGVWSRSYVKLAPQVQGGFGIDTGYNYATDIETLSVNTGVVALASAVPVIELNGNSQVTAIDGHTLAGGGSGGSSYTAGTGIDITNDVISVDNTVAMKTDIPELPEDEEVDFEEIDFSDFALASAIPDVSNLATKTELATVEAEVEAVSGLITPELPVVAGDGIDIQETNNQIVISSTVSGSTYTAGTGIDITNDVISLDEPVQLIAGDNVSISVSGVSAVISAQGGGGGSTYNEGLGIDISNNEISIDPSVVALVSAIPADKLFIANANSPSTSKAELDAALAAGKAIFCKVTTSTYGTSLLPMTRSGNDYVFMADTMNMGSYGTETGRKTIIAKYLNGLGWDYGITDSCVTKSELNTAIAGKANTATTLAGYGITDAYTKTEVDTTIDAVSGLITPELPVVAGTGIGITETSTEITIAVTGNYVSDSDLQSAIQTVEAEIPVVTGFATKATTLSGYGITDAYTKSEVNTRLNGKQSTLTGITDVQVVQSLPGSPVSTVLYLIPEV
jgi:hypothetical protein